MRFLTFPAFTLMGLGFLAPLIWLVMSGIFRSEKLIITEPYLLYVIRFTYWQAFLSASLSLIMGFVGAFLVEELKIKGGKWLWRLCLLCSALPPLIVSLGILGSWGQFLNLFGWAGILMGHVFLNFPIPLRLIGMSLRDRDRESETMALSLGASPLYVFRRLTLYSLYPSLISSWILAFLYSSTSLFVLMFLGGGPRFTTLEVALYEAIKWNLDTGKAIQIALIQALVGGLLFYVYLLVQKRKVLEGKSQGEFAVFHPRRNLKFFLESLWWLFVLAFLMFPLFSIIRDGLISLSEIDWTVLLGDLITTLLIAFAVGTISLLLLYPILHYYYHFRDHQEKSLAVWVLSGPQFFSPLVIALALTFFYPQLKGSSLGGLMGVILAQTLFVFPIIHIPLREGFLRLSQEKMAIAQSLGASAVKRFISIELPSMKRPIIFSFLVAVSFSMGEVVTFLVFSPQSLKTLSLNIFQSMSRYRFQEAHASTFVLVLSISLVLGFAGYWESKNG